VPPNLNIAVAQFTWCQGHPLSCPGVLYPQKIRRQQPTKAKVHLPDTFGRESAAVFEPSGIDPLLDGNVSLGCPLA